MPVRSVYLGNFQDVTAAKEAAVNMISRGADFVIPDADAAGIGVIQAVREAGPNICTFGVFTDITSTAPDNILGTYLADYAQGVERIVAGIKNGSPLPTSNVVFGLKDADVMKFTYNDKAKAGCAGGRPPVRRRCQERRSFRARFIPWWMSCGMSSRLERAGGTY